MRRNLYSVLAISSQLQFLPHLALSHQIVYFNLQFMEKVSKQTRRHPNSCGTSDVAKVLVVWAVAVCLVCDDDKFKNGRHEWRTSLRLASFSKFG